MYSGRYEVVLPVTFCFVKIGAVLGDILASQKCIKWGWRIIRGWMTVCYLLLLFVLDDFVSLHQPLVEVLAVIVVLASPKPMSV